MFCFIRYNLRIISGYKLWPTNYMAYDLINGTDKYAANYTPEEMEYFQGYIAKQLMQAEPMLDRGKLKDILLHIYSNPVQSKENLALECKE